MVAHSSFVRLVRLVHEIGRPKRWAVLSIIALGLFAALLEGLGLLLFIPLIRSLGASTGGGGGVERLLEDLLRVIPQSQQTALLVGLLFALILLKNLVNLANVAVAKYMDGDVAHRLRERIFTQVLASCIDYKNTTKRADIATTLSTNSWRVSTSLSIFYNMLVAAVTAFVFVTLMAAISTFLAACTLVFLAVMAVMIRTVTREADTIGMAVVRENKEFGQRMWESMNSLQVIRAFGRERFEEERFVAASDNVRRRLWTLDVLWALPAGISEVAIVGLIGALILVATQVGVGIAALAAFLSLLYRLQGPARILMQDKVALDGMSATVDDVAQLLESSSRPFLKDGHGAVAPLRSAIEFENVSFRYGPEEAWAVQDVSVSIPAGKTTAIVGRSGAGKSTMLALLFRFYDPVSGKILIDGTPLDSLRLAEWRTNLSLMSQDVHLFHDTVAANIGYGRLEATQEEIVEAARIAHADEFISSLPQGYHTVLGDQGLRLSGGQRQRIALARTILRDPDILLLDEATNALDIESEQAFQFALKRYSQARTVVVIAHRLATIRDADQIIVMDGGRVVEVGPPDRLLGDEGKFARMVNLQGSGSDAIRGRS